MVDRSAPAHDIRRTLVALALLERALDMMHLDERGNLGGKTGRKIDHLDQVAGPRALTPAHGPERRKVLKICAVSTGCSDKTVSLFFERQFHKKEAVSVELDKRIAKQLKAGIEWLEHECGTPWFIDNKMSQADVTIGCMLSHVKLRLPEFFPADKYPKLHALARHCEMMPEFDAARIGANETVPKKL